MMTGRRYRLDRFWSISNSSHPNAVQGPSPHTSTRYIQMAKDISASFQCLNIGGSDKPAAKQTWVTVGATRGIGLEFVK